MYQKYQTDALVLGSRESGEADRVYTLYAHEFGLIRARALAVRTETSRMRYALQNYARVRISLVRGKRGWRIAGATLLRSVVKEKTATATFARIARLTTRLVAGEEESSYLYGTLAEAHEALMSPERGGAAPLVEIICIARILYALGYLSTEALGTALFAHTAYALPEFQEVQARRKDILTQINKALADTQL